MVAKINKLYRAFIDYRKVTATDSDLKRERKSYKLIDKELEFFEAIKIDCTIDEDWVEAIESKIEYVTKAVNEERQFIETIGEVVPIEKVKKVSKDSVKHLAKHSNLITKVPEDEDDMIPEKLYMVEKISDYTVYENRFLYMLLCYMRDFIDLRVSKINEAISTYKSDFKMKKTIETKSRVLNFETSLFEDRKDNPYPLLNEKTKSILNRINTFTHDVNALLKTDLMQQVSEAPMIKPPITKTNVLKMNNNFKNAVALYEYLNTYDKVGYTLKEVKVNLEPFVDPMSDEIVELVTMTSFLSYKYGNDLEETLKAEYEEEERLRRIEENKRTAEQIKALKKRIKESGMSYDEYMLMLEKHNRQLEKDSADLVVARNEIEQLKEQIGVIEKEKEVLKITIDELNKTIEELHLEIEQLNQKYIDDMAKKDAEHKVAIEQLNEKHENAIKELKENHATEISNINEANKKNVESINAQHQINVKALKESHETEKQAICDDYETRIIALNTINQGLKDDNASLSMRLKENQEFLNSEIARLENDRVQLIDECNRSIKDTIAHTDKEVAAAKALTEAAIEESRYANAKLNAVKKMHGMLTDEDDFTSREKFKELELQRKAFKKLYKEEWKKTKQRIKSEVFELNNSDENEQVLTPESTNDIEKIHEELMPVESVEEVQEVEIEEVIQPEEVEEVEQVFIEEPSTERVLEPVMEEDEEPTLEEMLESVMDEESEIEENDTNGLFDFNFKNIKFRSLDEKLKSMSPELTSLYNEIKNDFMKYEGIRSKLSKSYDCIYLGGRIVAKLSITSTKVKVYLAADPNKYNNSQYPHKDLSDRKTHMNTPYFALIKSPLSIRRIKSVYKDIMDRKGVNENASYSQIDYVKALSEE